MFRPTCGLRKEVANLLKKSSFVAQCDDSTESKPNLIEQADAKLYGEKLTLSTPVSYENFKNSFNQASVPSYDGFRLILQKQVNLNTVVSHFYWIGSQATGQPIYQYRIILPFDDTLINVSTDAGMNNVEGEVRLPIARNMVSKVNFTLGEQSQLSGDLEITDESSNTLLQFSKAAGASSLTLSYMQALTPNITLGGSGSYSSKNESLVTGLAAIYNNGQDCVSGQWDENIKLQYTKKVNPNRVHLTTDLTIDPAGNSQMGLGAEYFLKQGKVHLGIDSNLQIKSLVETAMAPGVQLQFAADVNQLSNSYRFGYGLVIGN